MGKHMYVNEDLEHNLDMSIKMFLLNYKLAFINISFEK